MIIGINLSHDSSVAIAKNSGELIHAVGEERFTRKKNELKFPVKSLEWLSKIVDLSKVSKVVIGSHSKFNLLSFSQIQHIFRLNSYPNFDAQHLNVSPPFKLLPNFEDSSDASGIKRKILVQDKIKAELNRFQIFPEIFFRNHHECHVMSAVGNANFETGLGISLDGEGDGESGLITKFSYKPKFTSIVLNRVPSNQSLGNLYSAITERYNFKHTNHEGKITGLAAYGKAGPALVFLMKHIEIKNGIPNIRITRNAFLRIILKIIRELGIRTSLAMSLSDLADIAASKSDSYPDLAFAVQAALEEIVISLILNYVESTKLRNIALAGGVFANVKLNQKISENREIEKVYIFPNMGDGGLAVGGIWDYLATTSSFQFGPKFKNMYLGVEANPSFDLNQVKVQYPNIKTKYYEDEDQWVEQTVKLLQADKIVGVIRGAMEFGPRALLNRSIIASPRSPNLNLVLNSRLKRTEFMPFAPVCTIENLGRVFHLKNNSNLINFKYMTITCDVNSNFLSKIPAVVHIDKTARPQSVSFDDNPLMYKLLKKFELQTGLPCLINTSFNAHEEPILLDLYEGFDSLNKREIDFLITDKYIFSAD